ncbi:hypothetical protein JQ641_09735 [Bradyrhizobium sp. JYMT SZCCT0180]|nr:hypothetical protein [Bradyrhizobium sp. JYMT SZCCT0180]
MEVAAWQCSLGLGRYEQAFRENDIDGEVLVDLVASTRLLAAHKPRPDVMALWHEACSVCSAGNFSVPVQE